MAQLHFLFSIQKKKSYYSVIKIRYIGIFLSSSNPATLKLLAFLTDWILNSQMFTSRARNDRKRVDQCQPPVVVFGERCVQVAYSPWLHFDSLLFCVSSFLVLNLLWFFRCWRISFATLLCHNLNSSSTFFASLTGP